MTAWRVPLGDARTTPPSPGAKSLHSSSLSVRARKHRQSIQLMIAGPDGVLRMSGTATSFEIRNQRCGREGDKQ